MSQAHSAIAGFFALVGVIFSILSAISCEFMKSGTGFGLFTSTGLGIFRASITVGQLEECRGYDAEAWQAITARVMVCLGASFGGLALLALIGHTTRLCSLGGIGVLGLCGLAMTCQGLTFLLFADRIFIDEVDLGMGGIFSIVSTASYMVATCASCASTSRDEDDA